MKIRKGLVVQLWLEHNCGKSMNWVILDTKDYIKVQCEKCGKVVLLTEQQFLDFYLKDTDKDKGNFIKKDLADKIIENRVKDNYIRDLKWWEDEINVEYEVARKIYHDFVNPSLILNELRDRYEQSKILYKLRCEVRKEEISSEYYDKRLKKLGIPDRINYYGTKYNIASSVEINKLLSWYYLYKRYSEEIEKLNKILKRKKSAKGVIEELILKKQFYMFCVQYLYANCFNLFPLNLCKLLREDKGKYKIIDRILEKYGFEKRGINDLKEIMYLVIFPRNEEDAIERILYPLLMVALDKRQLSIRYIHEISDTMFIKYFGDEYLNRIKSESSQQIELYPINENRVKYFQTNYSSFFEISRLIPVITCLQIIDSSNNHVTRQHDIENLEVNIVIKNGELYKVISYKCHYCKDCNIYFDFENSFFSQMKSNHIDIKKLCLQLIRSEGMNLNIEDFSRFNRESKLHMLGYVVGKNGKSKSYRQKLLNDIVKEKFLSIAEIKTCLNHNISQFESRYEYNVAVKHWKEDIDYLNSMI